MNDAIYVTEFSDWMTKHGILVPSLYPLKNPQTGGSKYVYPVDETKSYVMEKFIEGRVLGMNARATPSHPEFHRILEFYRSVGVITAKINNATMAGFQPPHHRMFPSRESVVESMKVDYFRKLSEEMASRDQSTLNLCEKFFRENFQDIVDNFTKQVQWFQKYWKPEKQVKAHIHNDLHFQNVIFQSEGTEIAAVIDWERAQYDCRVVEFNNIVMAVIDVADTNRERLFYDADDITKVFVCTAAAYQENATLKLSPEEIVGAWEVIRARVLEVFWKNYDQKLNYFAFKHPSRLAVLQNHLNVIKVFPEHPPSV